MEADANAAKPPESENALTTSGSGDSPKAPDSSNVEKGVNDGSLTRYFDNSPTRDLYPLLPPLGREGFTAGAAPAPPKHASFSIGMAAAIGLLLTGFGALAVYDHDHQSTMLARKDHESQTLAGVVASLKTRLDDIEAARSKDESADFRKLIGEVRAGGAASREIGNSVTQLGARVDHIEKDQGARFDKFAERIDQATATKLNDIAARLDKIEKKSAAPVAAVAPLPTAPAAPAKATAAAKPEPSVSNETTGAIEKPKAVLRAFAIEEVRGGVALVDTVDGTRTVAEGDFLPGAGRVLRIERRQRGWAMVTTNGLILSDAPPY